MTDSKISDLTSATSASGTDMVPIVQSGVNKRVSVSAMVTAAGGGGDALTTNPLSQFASTTSAQLAGVLSDETGTGKTMFNTAPTLEGKVQLAENASISLDPAGSADGKYSGITIDGTAGATVAFGDLLMLDAATSKWRLVNISAAAGATGDARGLVAMCVLASTDTNPVTVLLTGVIRADAKFPTLTINAPVYASNSGAVVVTQPTTTDHVIRKLGAALTADEFYFNPSPNYTTHT